jgi:hypothetical protein
LALDLSVLVGFTGSTSALLAANKASRAAAAREAASPTAAKVNVTTPWEAATPKSESARLVAAMQTKTYIDEKDTSFDKPGVPEDYKKLFAVYKGLATLQVLANAASDKKTESGRLAGLDRRFQDGFAQVMKYAGSLELDSLSLLTGPKSTTAKSTAAIARPSSITTTKTLVQGDAQASMKALESAEPFTITVSRGTTKTDIQIDLSEMGSTTRNLGNVINFINGKLGDAGVQTRLKRIETTPETEKNKPVPAKQYAMQIDTGGAEALTFTSSAPSTALYLANQGVNAGELRKLAVDGAEPSTVYRAAITNDGTELNVKSTVNDSDGNVFVLGTTNGDEKNQVNQSASDVMLRKYDSAGNLVWSKLMGSTERADGLALAVDSDGSAVIAGQISGKLGTAVSAGAKDSFVIKIGKNGEEVFSRQIGSIFDDGATALAIDADGAIYVGGQVKGRMVGATAAFGGNDAYVTKYDANGARLYTRQFGTAGEERVSALAIADDGALVVATTESGQGVVRKFAAADGTSAAVWAQNLGDLSGGGSIAGLAVENNSIYLAGSSVSGSLNGGPVVTAHSGGQDGYVMKLTDAGASVSQDFVTYLGTGSTDRINGIAVSNGRIFVAGDTKGQLPGATITRAETTNAFAAELSGTGSLEWARQFGVTTGEGYGRGIAVDAGGASSALDTLGLSNGKAPAAMTRTVTAQTTARPGDFFYVQVGDLTARKITIEAGETMTTLARKLNSVLTLNGKASPVRNSTGETIRIEPREGQSVTLKAGTGNLDALAGLGLSAGRFVKPSADGDAREDTSQLPTYAMGLKSGYSLLTTESAVDARSSIDAAMTAIRKAYREMNMTPEQRAALTAPQSDKPGKRGGSVPTYLSAQLANYNAGLQRLQSNNSTGALF